MTRLAAIDRKTRETQIQFTLDLDGSGRSEISTSVPFMDEMLRLVAKEGRFDLTVKSTGDTHIDDHHLVEDLGIAFGEVLTQAVGDKKGITRYGNDVPPADKTQSYVALDLSNRPYFIWKVKWPTMKIGKFDGLLLEHFFESIAMNARMNLHMAVKPGKSPRQISEILFKSFARALAQAITLDPRVQGVPSTKGLL